MLNPTKNKSKSKGKKMRSQQIDDKIIKKVKKLHHLGANDTIASELAEISPTTVGLIRKGGYTLDGYRNMRLKMNNKAHAVKPEATPVTPAQPEANGQLELNNQKPHKPKTDAKLLTSALWHNSNMMQKMVDEIRSMGSFVELLKDIVQDEAFRLHCEREEKSSQGKDKVSLVVDEQEDEPKKDNGWMSLKQVIKYTGLSSATLNRHIDKGMKVSRVIPGKLLFRQEWIDKYLEGK